jgi:hypothetical protein
MVAYHILPKHPLPSGNAAEIVFLVTCPGGTLIGARATRAEVNRLIEEHAMNVAKKEIEDGATEDLTLKRACEIYARVMTDYKVETVVSQHGKRCSFED